MRTLYFEKLSQYDRVAEPVTVSIPFGQGKLPDADHFVIDDDGEALPSQQRALAHWPDGSVKWLLVHLQPDLPGNLAKTLNFRVASGPGERPAPPSPVRVTEEADSLLVDTGPLRFRVPRAGFLPVQDVVLAGDSDFDQAWPTPFTGFKMETDVGAADSSRGAVELEIEEAGPLRAVILVRGRHLQPDGSEFLALRGRITAYAGKAYIEVEHQYLHTLDMAQVTLQGLRLDFAAARQGGANPQLALGEGWYRTAIQQSDREVSQTLDTDTMLYQSNEHFIDSYYGDFWCDWRDAQGGLCLSIHQAHQNFPKKAARPHRGYRLLALSRRRAVGADLAGDGQDPPRAAPFPRAGYAIGCVESAQLTVSVARSTGASRGVVSSQQSLDRDLLPRRAAAASFHRPE